jgi:large subunit ribosomal protein L19
MEREIKLVQDTFVRKEELPAFKAGDNVSVSYRIIEGGKERIQIFKGDVINVRGEGTDKMFTVRKVTNGTGVERVFPMHTPFIEKVVVNKIGKVRRAKLFYLRELTGKSARIKEKR